MENERKRFQSLIDAIGFDRTRETEESWMAQRVLYFQLVNLWRADFAGVGAAVKTDRIPNLQYEYEALLDTLFSGSDSIADKASALQSLILGVRDMIGPEDMAIIEHFENTNFN